MRVVSEAHEIDAVGAQVISSFDISFGDVIDDEFLIIGGGGEVFAVPREVETVDALSLGEGEGAHGV